MWALVLRGEKNITCVDIALSEFTVKKFSGKGVKFVLGSATDAELMAEVLKDADVVITPFANIRYFEWMPKHLKRSTTVNVDGIQTLLDASIKAGVKRFIATSSSHATFTGDIGPFGFDERAPLATPENAIQCYGLSKAMAEQLVLLANGKNSMATGVIRPTSQVIGFRDKNLFDRYISTATVLVYTDCLAEWVDVDDVVLGHLLLEKRLRNGCNDEAAGESFNIAAAEPYTFENVGRMLIEQGKQLNFSKAKFRITHVPERFMFWIAAVMDFLNFIGPTSVDMTRRMGELKFWTFSTMVTTTMQPCASESRNVKAGRLLGYVPHLRTETVIRRILREFEANDILFD